jgi:hypothetical protein
VNSGSEVVEIQSSGSVPESFLLRVQGVIDINLTQRSRVGGVEPSNTKLRLVQLRMGADIIARMNNE